MAGADRGHPRQRLDDEPRRARRGRGARRRRPGGPGRPLRSAARWPPRSEPRRRVLRDRPPPRGRGLRARGSRHARQCIGGYRPLRHTGRIMPNPSGRPGCAVRATAAGSTPNRGRRIPRGRFGRSWTGSSTPSREIATEKAPFDGRSVPGSRPDQLELDLVARGEAIAVPLELEDDLAPLARGQAVRAARHQHAPAGCGIDVPQARVELPGRAARPQAQGHRGPAQQGEAATGDAEARRSPAPAARRARRAGLTGGFGAPDLRRDGLGPTRRSARHPGAGPPTTARRSAACRGRRATRRARSPGLGGVPRRRSQASKKRLRRASAAGSCAAWRNWRVTWARALRSRSAL